MGTRRGGPAGGRGGAAAFAGQRRPAVSGAATSSTARAPSVGLAFSPKRFNVTSAVESIDEGRLFNFDFVPHLTSPVSKVLLPQIFSPTVAAGVLAGFLVYFHVDALGEAPTVAFNIIGVLVSLVTVFRTSQSYGRYWEGRSHLGMMMAGVVDLASAAGAVLNSGNSTDEEWRSTHKAEVARLLHLYMMETTYFLREASLETKSRTNYWRDYAPLMDIIHREFPTPTVGEEMTAAEEQALKKVSLRARPAVVLQWVREALQAASMAVRHVNGEDETLVAGSDPGQRLRVLSLHVAPAVGKIQAEFNGCAKIASTAFPVAYVRIGRVLRFFFVYTAPFFLAARLGWGAIPVCSLLAFGYHGIDAAALALCDPFIGEMGDVMLDGRFLESTCFDIDELLVAPRVYERLRD